MDLSQTQHEQKQAPKIHHWRNKATKNVAFHRRLLVGLQSSVCEVLNHEPEPERGVVDEGETDVRKVSVLCKSYDMARDKTWNENMFLMEGTT